MKLEHGSKLKVRVVVACAVMAMAAGFAQAQNVGVFVSSQTTDGNIGGLAGADAICEAEGSMRFPAFAGPWTAWLSDSHTDASSRVAQPGAGGAYVRASDGTTVIAADLAALTSVNLVNEIDPVFSVVWTGTGADGLRLGALGDATPAGYCGDWTSSMPPDPVTGLPQAWVGNSNQVSHVWTENGLGQCDSNILPVYCFSQALDTAPTLPQYALLALALLLAAAGFIMVRRRFES